MRCKKSNFEPDQNQYKRMQRQSHTQFKYSKRQTKQKVFAGWLRQDGKWKMVDRKLQTEIIDNSDRCSTMHAALSLWFCFLI